MSHKNVVSPALKNELLKDWHGHKYAIIVDESADCLSQKHLRVLLRYYGKSNEKNVTRFLQLPVVPITTASGENNFNGIKKEIEKCGQSLKTIGYASDGAANMVGEVNSVWSRLRRETPDSVMFNCLCLVSSVFSMRQHNSRPAFALCHQKYLDAFQE